MIGIYKITSPSSKIYIGQSIDIQDRERKYSQKNCKNQVRLHRSICKYGWESHLFEIIEECDINILNERERYWQDFYNCIGEKGLNCNLINTSELKKVHSDETKNKIGKANKGKKRTEEDILKMSERMKGRFYGEKHPMYGKKHSKETLMKISELKKGNKNMLGKKHSKETKKKLSDIFKGFKHTEEAKNKISESLKGRIVTKETRNKISESNKGTVFSEDRKEKISKALTGRKIPKEVLIKRSKTISRGGNYKARLIINIETGIYYDCIQDAADSVNMNRSTLNNYLCGNRKNKTSFIYA
jgi:group I intron endonuclease